MPDDDTFSANDWRAILVLLGGTINVPPYLRNRVFDKVAIAAAKAMETECEHDEPTQPRNISKPPF